MSSSRGYYTSLENKWGIPSMAASCCELKTFYCCRPGPGLLFVFPRSTGIFCGRRGFFNDHCFEVVFGVLVTPYIDRTHLLSGSHDKICNSFNSDRHPYQLLSVHFIAVFFYYGVGSLDHHLHLVIITQRAHR